MNLQLDYRSVRIRGLPRSSETHTRSSAGNEGRCLPQCGDGSHLYVDAARPTTHISQCVYYRNHTYRQTRKVFRRTGGQGSIATTLYPPWYSATAVDQCCKNTEVMLWWDRSPVYLRSTGHSTVMESFERHLPRGKKATVPCSSAMRDY